MLRWKAKWTDKSFGAHVTSDGSLRFFALATLLNLPPGMLPDVLLLDEPELGLHPAAVSLIGDMIKALSNERQIIVATQSPLLVDAFDISEITVLELRDGRRFASSTKATISVGWTSTPLANSGRRISWEGVLDTACRIGGRPT